MDEHYKANSKSGVETPNPAPPVEVPPGLLSEAALRAVLESYILREGTDYGVNELSMETKVANLQRRIANGSAILVFDPNTESITFMTKSEWGKSLVTKR